MSYLCLYLYLSIGIRWCGQVSRHLRSRTVFKAINNDNDRLKYNTKMFWFLLREESETYT